MPLLQDTYIAPSYFKNGHIQTIYASALRKLAPVSYQRKVVTLKDGDFVELDYSSVNAQKVVIILHGLGGNSQRPHVKGLVHAFNKHGFDAIAMNMRGANGMNKTKGFYHSGKSDDLSEIVDYVLANEAYPEIYLAGYSLGGNVVLKYVGEKGATISPKIIKAATMSVPCDLGGCARAMDKYYNYVYVKRFLNDLKRMASEKSKLFPNEFDMEKVHKSYSFYTFDEAFTAPAHGFRDAQDYYDTCSTIQFIPKIQIPTLLISAEDDSFLNEECYPSELAKKSDIFHFMRTQNGGHVGFLQQKTSGMTFTEQKFVDLFCH